jgi:hypothetical protein
MSDLICYGFRDAISGFFEFPTDNARRILPSHLEPVELHHGSSVFSMTAFDFTDSPVGPYAEVVLSVVVAPLIKAGARVPKSAVYPYLVATTTREAREHAIDRWHLPHWMEDVAVEFSRGERQLSVRVSAGSADVAEMTVAEFAWQSVRHLYQAFMQDGANAYLAHVTMEGAHSEHEEELGRLRLFAHPFHRELAIGEVEGVPFRETWMREGVQSFEPLAQLEIA